jgi:transcription-repair coupling factor (superfamily II helicase)
LKLAKLKLAARAIGIRRLDLGVQGGTVTFEERNSLDPATVVAMIQRNPREYRLEGSLKLRASRQLPTESARFEFAAELMKRLAEKPAPRAVEKARGGGKPTGMRR